jgi:thioredoxin 1
MSKLIQITQENINEILNESEKIVVLDFYSPECGPCRDLTPILEDLANEYSEKAIFAKINAREFEDLCNEHRVVSVPNILIFKNGKVIQRHIGLESKSFFKKLLDALI